jgi:hypothetical protein
MKKDKYYTKDIDNNWIEIDEEISDNVLRQYFERRYLGASVMFAFIVGFLLGVIAS